MRTFDGFDPKSTTLVRSPLNGKCMRHEISDEFKTVLTDAAAPIRSGDLVRLHIAYSDGDVRSIIKRLNVSRSGSWWASCADGTFQVGALIQPFNCEKVVGLDTEQLVSGPLRPVREADAELAAHFAMLAREVVEEWRTQGHIYGAQFPGLNRVNYFLEDGVRNPDYIPPVPL